MPAIDFNVDIGSPSTRMTLPESIMLFISQRRRALAAFVLLVVLAVLASAVSVAFGAGDFPWRVPEATTVTPGSGPAPTTEREVDGASPDLQRNA